jgi:hypothetical protein
VVGDRASTTSAEPYLTVVDDLAKRLHADVWIVGRWPDLEDANALTAVVLLRISEIRARTNGSLIPVLELSVVERPLGSTHHTGPLCVVDPVNNVAALINDGVRDGHNSAKDFSSAFVPIRVRTAAK